MHDLNIHRANIKKILHVEKTLTNIRAYRIFFVMIWDGFELEKSL